MISEKEYVADIFNNYFNKIAEGLGFNDPIPNDFHDDDVLLSAIKYDSHPSIIAIKSALKCNHSFCFAETNASDAYRILIKQNAKKYVGYDDIPGKFLQIGATPLAGISCQMVDISLKECNFPDLLKFAEIAALFIKLDKLLKENSRPVSILTAISKVFGWVFGESVVYFLRSDFFQNFYLVLDRYSCQTSLLRMIEDWKSELDNGNIIGTVAIGLTRPSIAYHTAVCSSLNCMHME